VICWIQLIEDFRYEGTQVYARLRAPGGDGTIALHQGWSGGFRFERRCASVLRSPRSRQLLPEAPEESFYITQLPRMMPWGWRHAYSMIPMATRSACIGQAKTA